MARKMTTRFIGIREYRRNLSKLIEEARKKNIHFVVMRHSKIVAHVTPPTEKEMILEELVRDVAEAREQARRGEVYTEEEIAKKYGIEL